MSLYSLFNPRSSRAVELDDARTEHVMIQRPLQRVLAFTRRSIDDVVNDPIVKREVLGYYKLYRQIGRAVEVSELERQWNI